MVSDREKSAANRLPKADDVRRKILTSSSDQSTLALTVTSLSDGRIVDVNDGFVQLSGYAREEAIGRTPDELGLWSDAQEREARFTRLKTGEPVPDIEARFRLKNGEERVGLIGSAVVGINGERCVVSSVVDITDRKRAEDALRESAAQARRLLALNQAIMANMGEGMYAVDGHGLVTYMNAEAERLFGWTSEELLGRRMHDVTHHMHPDGSPFPIEECAGFKARHEGEVLKDFEDTFIKRDGTFFPVSYSSAPLRDEDGQIVGVVVVFQDITARKRADQAFRESREQLAVELAGMQRLQDLSGQLIRENNIDALYEQVLDAAVAIMRSDFASIQMYDLAADELRLLGHRGFNEDAARFWASIRSVSDSSCAVALRAGTRVIVSDVLTCEALAGSEHLRMFAHTGIRSVQSTPLISRYGSVLGMISTHWGQPYTPSDRDLRVFDVLARQAADLIERSQAEQRLRESEAHLRQVSQVKDEFLATLSHELRTPLNAVLGWAKMLRAGTLRPEIAERALESLERNAKAQAQLVDDLLDVSRVISGKLQINHELVELAGVIASAVDTVRPAALAKHLSLRVNADPNAQTVVNGDADRLRQIVWNLLSNAIKFTPAHGQVDIVLRRVNSHAEIVVRDTGDGIDGSFLPFVFDRFRQADGTTTRRHGGLGLGLAIVRHLAEAHGGTATAHSDGLGQGATFTVCLPVTADTTRTTQRQRDGAERIDALALKGTRILVVDDEADARDLLRVVLESQGADVTVTASVDEALGVLDREAFQVLVADIGMPDRDGYALIQAVRDRRGPNATIPAIAVTAYASARERETALAAGYNAHLAKPIEPEQLLAAISRPYATA